MNIKKTANYWN